jgi:hypothetical protein
MAASSSQVYLWRRGAVPQRACAEAASDEGGIERLKRGQGTNGSMCFSQFDGDSRTPGGDHAQRQTLEGRQR